VLEEPPQPSGALSRAPRLKADQLVDPRTDFIPETDDFRGISLCAGYAGLDLGLHIAESRYRTVAFVERESHAAAALVARMEDQALGQAPIWDDLRTFDARPWRDRIHLVSAGYPCQPFSYAGKRRGHADPRHLWPEVARIVDEARPEWVWCENVEGHLALGYADVARDLRELGYTTKAGLFTAREAGARHRRRRLFILAHADSVRCRLRARDPDQRSAAADGRAQRDIGQERWPDIDLQRGPKLDGVVAGDESAGLVAGNAAGIFAPGPGELQAWDDFLRREPGCQPALPRADNGVADRLDRTRGAGNGVCSLAAALAWSVLKAAHQLDA
jgi:DNA (cytosine-5)-methyltransferase 1